MPPVQLSLAPAQLHTNQQLFSDYYLDQILPQRADWRLLAAEAAPVLAQLRALYAAFTPSTIEAQTEDDLIKPVLAALGHSFEVQAPLRSPDGTKKPDYVFYRDQAARDANKNLVLDDTLPTQAALAVGDAKFWDRPLDTAHTQRSSAARGAVVQCSVRRRARQPSEEDVSESPCTWQRRQSWRSSP